MRDDMKMSKDTVCGSCGGTGADNVSGFAGACDMCEGTGVVRGKSAISRSIKTNGENMSRYDSGYPHPMVVARALNLWDYNVSVAEKFDAVYGVRPVGDSYREEKVQSINRMSLAAWMGHLDYPRQQALVEAALDKYGDDALRWMSWNIQSHAEADKRNNTKGS